MLELWLIPYICGNKPNYVFQHDREPNTSTKRWRPSSIDSCFSKAEERVNILETAIFISDTLRSFSVRLYERWSLRSANAYNFEQIEGSTKKSDSRYRRAFMFGMRSNIVFMCSGLPMEHILNVHGAHNVMSCSLQTWSWAFPTDVCTYVLKNYLFLLSFLFRYPFLTPFFVLFLSVTSFAVPFLLPSPFLFFLLLSLSFRCYFLLIAPFVVSLWVFLFCYTPLFFIPFLSFFIHSFFAACVA
jgi:hypothetical protein